MYELLARLPFPIIGRNASVPVLSVLNKKFIYLYIGMTNLTYLFIFFFILMYNPEIQLLLYTKYYNVLYL